MAEGHRNDSRFTSARMKKHGWSRTPEYLAWAQMRYRCCRPGHPSYVCYGDRGIKVCERWVGEDSFPDFLADMGPRPSPKHSIDRIDNDGDYELSNCRWATRKAQMRNTRQNRLLTYDGQTRCLAEWAEIMGTTFQNLMTRIRSGWSVERTLGTPIRKRGPNRPKTAQ